MNRSQTVQGALEKRHMSHWKDAAWGIALLLPFMIFYVAFNLYPMVQGFIISLFKWNLTGSKVFLGLGNYEALLRDARFFKSLMNTLMYVAISTPVFMLGSLAMAIIVDSKVLKVRTFVRAVFFLPNVLAVSIMAVIWLNMLQPYMGLMNAGIHALGIPQEVFWLSDPNLVWISIIMVTFWWNTGYYMLIYLAGLQEIPEEQYEAADIDGANGIKRLWYITLPSLKSTHLLVLFLQVIASFKIFGQVFLITEGGPGGASRTLLQYVYEVGFTTFQMGKASAAAFVLLAIILVISLFQFKVMNSQEK